MCYTIASCFPFEPLEKCMTFKDIFPGLSRSWNFREKNPVLSRRRGNAGCREPIPETSWMAWECCKLLLVYFDIKNRTMATTVILAVNEKQKQQKNPARINRRQCRTVRPGGAPVPSLGVIMCVSLLVGRELSVWAGIVGRVGGASRVGVG